MLKKNKSALLFDVFRGHKVQSVLTKLDEANIDHVFIPPNCTDRLQPLDVAINKPIKSFMKEKFIEWYSKQVQQKLQYIPKKNRRGDCENDSKHNEKCYLCVDCWSD